jgi:outer membrane protein OmpA-like peptidoglycan-associated protein
MQAAQDEADRASRANAAQMAAAQTEADRLKLQNDARTAAAQTQADRLKRDSDAQLAASQAANMAQLAAAQTQADRLKRDSDAQLAASQAANMAQLAADQTQADQLKRDSDAQLAASQAANMAQLAAAQTEADRLKRENDAQRAAAQADLDRAAKEKVDLRALLLSQFNAVLQTRDTARGLVVNMSDVLFDTAKYSLRPLAREKLAKVAGIVSGHPGLKLSVEGYTDSVGGDDYNQRLSEQRGSAVRDYLTQSGMAPASVTTQGFGKAQPVASNDTAQGRQQNRRVEIVISGEIIGTAIGTPIAAR